MIFKGDLIEPDIILSSLYGERILSIMDELFIHKNEANVFQMNYNTILVYIKTIQNTSFAFYPQEYINMNWEGILIELDNTLEDNEIKLVKI